MWQIFRRKPHNRKSWRQTKKDWNWWEKGLESTGRASNEYFAEKYKDDDTPVSIQSDGKDYSNVDFGKYMGDSLEDICFISITQCIVRYAGKKMGEETAKKVIKYINQKTKTIEKDMKNIKNNTKILLKTEEK